MPAGIVASSNPVVIVAAPFVVVTASIVVGVPYPAPAVLCWNVNVISVVGSASHDTLISVMVKADGTLFAIVTA